jgi:hypothetical protein
MKKVFLLLAVFIGTAMPAVSFQEKELREEGSFSLYYMNEQVGFEEFEWRSTARGFELAVMGRITKPTPVEINRMIIRVNPSYIPTYFSFDGIISGIKQTIASEISDGHVVNTIRAAGREQKTRAEIRRDAFLLPNPVFSAYMLITKKYRCSLKEEKQLSAYIIPQVEIPFLLKPDNENACLMIMEFPASIIELQTDPQGSLHSVRIPSQNLIGKRD